MRCSQTQTNGANTIWVLRILSHQHRGRVERVRSRRVQEAPATEELRLHPQAAAASTLTSIGSNTGLLILRFMTRVSEANIGKIAQVGGTEADHGSGRVLDGHVGLNEAA
jgi:hypothetical protein